MQLHPDLECYVEKNETSQIIDIINPVTGLTHYGKMTFEQVKAEYPEVEKMTLDQFCERKAKVQNTSVDWVEITKEDYHRLLDCLPPACYGEKSFLVGEPTDHFAGNGKPRYTACRYYQGKYEQASRPLLVSEFEELQKEWK